MTLARMARLLLPGLGALLLCAGQAGAQKGSFGVRAETVAILGRLKRGADLVSAKEQLLRLGLAALPDLFDILSQGTLPIEGDAPPLSLSQRVALQGALLGYPRAELLTLLGRLVRRSSAERERMAALELLARAGKKADLKLALELSVLPGSEEPPGPELRAALENSLSGIAARDPAALRALADYFARAHPAVHSTIGAVLARHGGEQAAELLTGILGSAGTGADALLLFEIAGLGPEARSSADLVALEKVRGYLGHPDGGLASLACLAVEHLGDHAAVPELIVLLEHSDQNVQRNAYRVLMALTRLSLECDPAPWMEWLDRSLDWWELRSEPCRDALLSGSASEAALAVREIAEQRLFLDRVAELLVPALERPEPDIVQLACRALGATRLPAARAALFGLRDHPDARVAETARATLKKLERSLSPRARAARPLVQE